MENSRECDLVAGLDEVGMGPLAGPIVVVVVAFPRERVRPAGVRDSKKCTAAQRARLAPSIVETASFIDFGFASPETIDRYGMTESWQQASSMALLNAPTFSELLIDGVRTVTNYRGRQEAVVKGDALHWQIAAASIVAKVIRDTEMHRLHEHWPEYGFASNSGYHDAKHREALLKLGPCPEHRRLFLRKILGG